MLKSYSTMKNSCVKWLGQVPAHWEVRWIGQFGVFSKGNGGSKEDEVVVGIPCVRYGDLYTTHQFFIRQSRSCVSSENADRYTRIKFGDVLFAASGETVDEIGKSAVNLIQSDARCGGDIVLFRPKREIEARYLGYVMDCQPAVCQKATMGRGITVIHIYAHQLKRLSVALPPLSEQLAIVRFLDHADRRIRRYIRAKEKLIALLEEQKQAVVHEAVTGRIDVRTGKPYPTYKPSGVKWLGDVPGHWSVAGLGSLGSMSKGNGGTKEDETDEGVPCIRYGDLYTSHKYFVIKARSNIAVGKAPSYTPIKFGDVLFAASGESIDDIGKSAVNLIESEARCGGDIIILRPRRAIDTRYLGYASDSVPSARQKASMGRGFTVMHIYGRQLRRLRLALPSLSEQTTIAHFLDSALAEIDDGIARARRQIDLLREYHTCLIADVVTGKLDVREAAAALPEVDPFAAMGETTPWTETEDGAI